MIPFSDACQGNIYNSGDVVCGGHKAVSCSKCSCGSDGLNKGDNYCNGDCHWENNECKAKSGKKTESTSITLVIDYKMPYIQVTTPRLEADQLVKG